MAKEYVEFTSEMKKTHTILCPQMAPIQFEFLEAAMQAAKLRFRAVMMTNIAFIPSYLTKNSSRLKCR